METKQAASNNRTPFIKGDPFTPILRERFQNNIWFATVVIALALNTPIIALAFINGLWVDQGSRTGLLRDYGWWIYQVTSVPASVLFFLWMPEGICSVLKGLRRNKTIILPDQQGDGKNVFDEFIDRFDRSYSHWAWAFVCFIGLIGFMGVAVVPEHRAFDSWQTSGVIVFWYHEIFWFLMFFVGALILVRILLVIYWFNRLFREFQVDVKVLHPDGAGGLSPLGAFSVKVGYLIGIFGLAAVTALWTQSAYLLPGQSFGLRINPAIIILTIVYLIVAPVVFFAPIGSAHSAMKTAKDAFILNVADQFEADFAKIQSSLGTDSNELKKGLEKIEQLREIHKMASNFPVWPFNTASLVRFFSSTLSPLILGLIPSFINRLF